MGFPPHHSVLRRNQVLILKRLQALVVALHGTQCLRIDFVNLETQWDEQVEYVFEQNAGIDIRAPVFKLNSLNAVAAEHAGRPP